MTRRPIAFAPTLRGHHGESEETKPHHNIMKATHFRILLATLLVSPAMLILADEEQDLISTLQSGAGAPQKWAACQRLRTIGTSKAVPALAALLTEQGLSQAARYVLEALPGAEADSALRDALGKTSGLLKAGVIDSMGWRGDSKSPSLIAPLLADPDTSVAAAAATALGRLGGPEAISALSATRDKVPATVQPALQEALLKCADRSVASNDTGTALRIYQDLFNSKYSTQIRAAVWRGMAMADSGHRAEIVLNALRGTDRPIQIVALQLVRELTDKQVLQACIAEWGSLGPESQLALLDAQIKLGPEALTLARRASQSTDLRLRVAAWHAFGELNNLAGIPALAGAAAHGEPSERDAARESLQRLRGPGANPGLLAQVKNAATPEKAELLRALGERGDNGATSVLLENATSGDKPVRQASLEGLTKLASPQAAGPLLEMAAKSKTDEERGPLLSALYAVCEASPNKAEISRDVVPMLARFPATERGPLLPLLPELGTADALAAAEAVIHGSDPELAKEGVRALSQWPNSAPAGPLLELGRSSPDPTLQTLALRGSIQVTAQEPDSAKRLALLQQAMDQTKRVEEKRLVLGQLAQIPMPEGLDMALKELTDPGLANEAALATLSIAEKLAPTHPDLADRAARDLLAHVHEGEIARRAWTLRHKPGINGPFIRDWVVCGPFRQAGVTGATAVFDIPFGPEKPGARLEWNNVPPSDHVNLAARFPGQDNCAAYLRTRIIAPEQSNALLLIGSDDGVKAWLNGKVVHGNNVDRGEVADQDTAPIVLNKGPNELLLKITQGGGGWGACARIVDTDFKPISGLRVECPKGQE